MICQGCFSFLFFVVVQLCENRYIIERPLKPATMHILLTLSPSGDSWKNTDDRSKDKAKEDVYKRQVLNVDLWKELSQLLEEQDVTFFWVKGHAGHPENERCDALATGEIKKW